MTKAIHTVFPQLTTERLVLRQLTPDDAAAIHAMRSNADINRYLDRKPSGSIDDAWEFISKVNQNFEARQAYYWGIALLNDNSLAGCICLFAFSDNNASCEIGYELLPQYQKQGIVTEAAKMVIAHAFSSLHVKIIEATLHKDNQPSLKLLHRLKFSPTGKIDETAPELVSYSLQHPA